MRGLHGLAGLVRVEVLTDRPEDRFAAGTVLFPEGTTTPLVIAESSPVADGRSARDGRSLETIGHYNPRSEPTEFVVDAERAKAWLEKGAQPSDTVARLFRSAGVLPAAK